MFSRTRSINNITDNEIDRLIEKEWSSPIVKKTGQALFEYQEIVAWIESILSWKNFCKNDWYEEPDKLRKKNDGELMRKFLKKVIAEDLYYVSLLKPLGLWTRSSLEERVGKIANEENSKGKIEGELGELQLLRNDLVHHSDVKQNQFIIRKPQKTEGIKPIGIREIEDFARRARKLRVLLYSISTYMHGRGLNFRIITEEKAYVSTCAICYFLSKEHKESRECLREGWEGFCFNLIAGETVSESGRIFDKYKRMYASKNNY